MTDNSDDRRLDNSRYVAALKEAAKLAAKLSEMTGEAVPEEVEKVLLSTTSELVAHRESTIRGFDKAVADHGDNVAAPVEAEATAPTPRRVRTSKASSASPQRRRR